MSAKIDALEARQQHVPRAEVGSPDASPSSGADYLARLEARIVALEEAAGIEIVDDGEQPRGWRATSASSSKSPNCSACQLQVESLRALLDEEREAKERALAAETAACEAAWDVYEEQRKVIQRLEAELAALRPTTPASAPATAESRS